MKYYILYIYTIYYILDYTFQASSEGIEAYLHRGVGTLRSCHWHLAGSCLENLPGN